MPQAKAKKTTATKKKAKATAKVAAAAITLTELAGMKLCLRRLSKSFPDGSVLIKTTRSVSCASSSCRTITRSFRLRAKVTSSDCDDPSGWVAGLGTQATPSDFTASLKSVSLGSGANTTELNNQRGFHTGSFQWKGVAPGASSFVVKGTMNGMTNVGTVRHGGNPFGHAPAACECEQKCDAAGFMEGQLFGTFSFRGTPLQVTASYRINYDPSVNENDPQCSIHAAIEGVLIAPCPA